MTSRGEATRARLLDAARRVVRDVGYAHTTTRAIARAAGVTEATIYRHFSDKRELLFAAVLDQNSATLDELAALPARDGHGTVLDNLVWALSRLATLRDDVAPLEIALLTDPQMGARPGVPLLDPTGFGAGVPGPPGLIAEYLAAEQRRGRVRAEIDPDHATVVLLVLLFGLSVSTGGADLRDEALAGAVRVVVLGIGEPPHGR